MKHKNRNGIDVEEAESLDLVTSPESNSSCLITVIGVISPNVFKFPCPSLEEKTT